ncbi:MAG TPA: 3-phosphoshikimate 1-carboxyvinyltransferase [Thermoplasmata archaeon]
MKSSVARGTITAPPSKSYTHRALVLGALTHDNFTLENPLVSEDTKATMDALAALGTEIRGNSSKMSILCEELTPARGTIDARNSGTTIRVIAGIASLLPVTTTLTGDDSLVRRPMKPLLDALEQLGAKCSYHGKQGCPPVSVKGPITGENASIQGGISSQFVSSLLIACTQKTTDTEISIEGEIASRPYVNITLQMLRHFGGRVEEVDNRFLIPAHQRFACDAYSVPGDYSSAAFPLAAAAITGGEVTVRNLDAQSVQGDRSILDFLRKFGVEVSASTNEVRVKGNRLTGAAIDVRHNPDLFPVLAVVGSLSEGRTTLTGGENLRGKESDRIATTTSFLQAMGARIAPRKDGCDIVGVDRLSGATVRTEGDHRMLMAAALAAFAASSETRIEDDESYKVSYPGFLRDMLQLGCRLEVRK